MRAAYLLLSSVHRDFEDHVTAFAADGPRRDAGADGHAIVTEKASQSVGEVGRLVGKNPSGALEQGDATAEPRERLRILERDVAPAEDDEVGRPLFQAVEILVREVTDVLQALDIGYERPCSGGDQDVLCVQRRSIVHLDGMGVGQPGEALDEYDVRVARHDIHVFFLAKGLD